MNLEAMVIISANFAKVGLSRNFCVRPVAQPDFRRPGRVNKKAAANTFYEI
jgi:hypothetical protein